MDCLCVWRFCKVFQWFSNLLMFCDDLIRFWFFIMICHDLFWYDDLIWFDLIWFNLIRYDVPSPLLNWHFRLFRQDREYMGREHAAAGRRAERSRGHRVFTCFRREREVLGVRWGGRGLKRGMISLLMMVMIVVVIINMIVVIVMMVVMMMIMTMMMTTMITIMTMITNVFGMKMIVFF